MKFQEELFVQKYEFEIWIDVTEFLTIGIVLIYSHQQCIKVSDFLSALPRV